MHWSRTITHSALLRRDRTLLGGHRPTAIDFGLMTTIKPALEIAARAAIAARTEELFRRSGAFREGHFLLKSTRHGDGYVEKLAVLSDPAATAQLCGFWAPSSRDNHCQPIG